MNNTMEYKGYVGSVEFSEEDGLFYGKVMGIRALISYEGSTAAELVNDSTVQWMIIWHCARKTTPHRNVPIRGASMSAFPRNCTSRRSFLQWPTI